VRLSLSTGVRLRRRTPDRRASSTVSSPPVSSIGPTTSEPATVRRDGTGSGVYFRSPEGHLLEVLTHSHQAVEPGERNRR
jgi:hypothetical protein